VSVPWWLKVSRECRPDVSNAREPGTPEGVKDNIRLGRVGGVAIGLNWSLIVIALLLALGLAENRFPADAPGAGGLAYAVAGVITAVALLLAVLLHELGHAVVARRLGMSVDGITLSWLGGVTRIEGDARTPGVELAIGAVGPAVSLAVGAILWLIRIPLDHGTDHTLVVSALGWLAVINVALAVFNLVPASPLDGGRILHAAIWRVTGDRWKATRGASRAGVGLGALMVVVGFSRLLASGDQIDGLILAVLGAWIISSARSEEQAGQVLSVLGSLRVADLMRPVGSAPGWITVRTFIEHHDSPHPGWVWLLERWNEPGYSGLVAGDDLRRLAPQRWDAVRPADVAVPADLAVAARAREPVLDALRRTNGHQVLLVIEDGRTVGAVLPADVEALIRTGRGPVTGRRRPAGVGSPTR
jgi:Zn-dependent protease